MNDRLWQRVVDYASLGPHRSGAATDRPTAEWFASEVADIGLTPTITSVAFDRFVSESELLADGEPVEHLVVPYEWSGDIETDELAVWSYPADHGGHPGGLDRVIAERTDGRRPLVLATEHVDGALVAVNRRIRADAGVPTVLVAGADLDRLLHASTSLRVSAVRKPGETHNVTATTGVGSPESRLVATTPLNGWFTCAGERGTGIAVLLDLIERFNEQPIEVVATGGHELGCLGARAWTERFAGPGRGVVHVGASIAVEEADAAPPRPLAGTRLAMTSLAADAATELGDALARANLPLSAGVDSWLGEATVYAELGVPMLSMTGAGRDFHTRNDTPARATSPAGLATATDAIADAMVHFLAATA